ncbi:MAG: NUDIX hydrolase [Chloroflexia bacterium]
MQANRIRPIAIGIFRRGESIFVAECEEPSRIFYRPLGGGIEFGERGHEALARELIEEIGAEIRDVRYLCTLENIFTYEGETGHEIVQVYEAGFRNSAFYEQDSFNGIEALADELIDFKAVWKPLSDFGPGHPPLYPDGLLEMLAGGET